MITAEELLARAAGTGFDDNTTEEHVTVGTDGYINVPESIKKLGVQGDHNANTVRFDCPRYWDGRDLSELNILINYITADGAIGSYLINDLRVSQSDDQMIEFSWVISDNVTVASGSVTIILCAKMVDSSGRVTTHWHSELNSEFYITRGLGDEDKPSSRYPDIIGALLTRQDINDAALLTAIPDALDVVAAVDQSNKNMVGEFDAYKQAYSTLIVEFDTLKQSYATMSSEFNTMKQSYATMSSEFNSLKQSNTSVAGELASLKQSNTDMIGEMNTFKSTFKTEEWAFTLTDGTIVKKDVYVL